MSSIHRTHAALALPLQASKHHPGPSVVQAHLTFSNRNCEPILPFDTRTKPCDAPKAILQMSAIDYWSPPAQLRLDLLSDLSVTASVNDPNIYRIFDDEVAFLRNTIRAINAWRNDIIPMCHLPSETLAHIFYFLAVIDPPWIRDLGWIKISHICRY
ncbi:hypothetical protein HETIRDRAFT_414310 [Heterobasidion irregulare TC 32-1]|uniref:F-box domain-containing protein n=1 Tax=Heterobasidion irregulare (strain TC 32-1) TaxID=747525 RepID=W4KJJ0_HETIT|nr:uncharacterized protein HETIRDRAFT_414310 [Heterobasidion irregulare TC 32-1]ETW85231.1 hypothetical protein HETIRDRAFT_414310 [Heterobasidion irregulare TC 32-1]